MTVPNRPIKTSAMLQPERVKMGSLGFATFILLLQRLDAVVARDVSIYREALKIDAPDQKKQTCLNVGCDEANVLATGLLQMSSGRRNHRSDAKQPLVTELTRKFLKSILRGPLVDQKAKQNEPHPERRRLLILEAENTLMNQIENSGNHEFAPGGALGVLPTWLQGVAGDTCARALAQRTCSSILLIGRTTEEYQSDELLQIFRIMDPTSEYSVDRDAGTSHATVMGFTSVYELSGDRFGCVRREGTVSVEPAILRMATEIAEQHIANRAGQSGSGKIDGALPDTEIPKVVMDFLHAALDDSAYAALVWQKGKTMEKYNEQLGISAESRLHGWSIAKSILSLLLGVRQSEGQLDVREYVSAPEILLEKKVQRGMTIDGFLSMRVGQPLDDTLGLTQELWVAPDAAAYALDSPMRQATNPGEFAYSNGNANVISRELRFTFANTTEGHAQYLAYPWKTLFGPLGAWSFACETDPVGTIIFSSFCYATARDFAKIGQLMLQGGTWNGHQVVPEDWVLETTATIPGDGDKYAKGWWKIDKYYPDFDIPAFAATGFQGQMLLILPEQEIIVVRLGAREGNFRNWFKNETINPLVTMLDALRDP